MAGLSSIFGRAKMTYRGAADRPAISDCCVNRALMPRWRGPQVMEDDSLAMGFVCHRCGREYLPSDVQNRRLIRSGAAPAAGHTAAAPAPSEAPAATEGDTPAEADETQS